VIARQPARTNKHDASDKAGMIDLLRDVNRE
jgi:hypothetical protein